MYILLKWMYVRGGLLSKVAIKLILRKEDVFHSITLRKLFNEVYDISAGIGSYGWQSGTIDGPAVIGKYTSIGPNVRRLKVNHPINTASTHPCFFNPIYGWVKKDFREYTTINIGSDVWIGANVVILPNVEKIGNGAIIAAGSVVTKNIPPYEIWGGVPAKFIKNRFNDNLGARLDESNWWDLSENELKTIVDKFRYPEEFLKSVRDIKNQD